MQKLHIFVVVIAATAAFANVNDLKKINTKKGQEINSHVRVNKTIILKEKEQNQKKDAEIENNMQFSAKQHIVNLKPNEETTITAIPEIKKLYEGIIKIKLAGPIENENIENLETLSKFTGKLLEKEDGSMVTEVQQKFLLTEPTTRKRKQEDEKKAEDKKKRIKKSSNFTEKLQNNFLNSTTKPDKYFHYENVTETEQVGKPKNDTKNIGRHFAVLTNAKMKTFRISKELNFPSITQLSTTTTPATPTQEYGQLFPQPNFNLTMKTTTEHQPTKAHAINILKPTIYTQKNPVKVLPTITLNTPTPLSMALTTVPAKSILKPISRPRTLSQLQMKINTLDCELNTIPVTTHLWRGNETHELLLPIMTTNNVTAESIVSWNGDADIQSGDVLIVEINDALLSSHKSNNLTRSHDTQVYQVTRSGHEHCDVTEGVLLDITPLEVDGRKLVTLYDKDLTEGINLLIVVSESWDNQCVRLKVTTKIENCGENADCSGKGVCHSSTVMEEYECMCCSGFTGPHCEEIDACTPSPCTNNGICVDLAQGHEGNSYQCLCPYGYTGKNCQYETDPCNLAECLNGGSCVGNSTHFRCDCVEGFKGPLCQHSLNECESSPCMHGICVDQEDGFRCFCQPGFSGDLCNMEYNECESNPCLNGGKCIDHIGKFECHCSKGFIGNRCETKADFCANGICPEGHRCINHANKFSCECPQGWEGLNCSQMVRTKCINSPCTHGGTCWSSGDTFYCACHPGYTGTLCEDEFVVETVISSREFMVDEPPTVVCSGLNTAYLTIGVLLCVTFVTALMISLCYCKINQNYRKFSTRSISFFPIIGFARRSKSQIKLRNHWLSDKYMSNGTSSLGYNGDLTSLHAHIYVPNANQNESRTTNTAGNLQERTLQRDMAINLENDMYYTVDFGEHSQQSPLMQ